MKYIVRNNKTSQKYLIKEKIKDAVSLRKGDWFITRWHGYNNYLFKVIDDKKPSIDGRGKSIIAEKYTFDDLNQTFRLYKEGRETIREHTLKDITVFGSAQEALKWLKHKLAVAKSRDSKINDSREALEYLIQEEERAINDYKKAIIESTNIEELDLYTHILREEIEHLEELKSKLNNFNYDTEIIKEDVKDSFKNTKDFEKVLLRKNIKYNLDKIHGEFSFKDKNEYNKAISLLENGFSLKYGGYDRDDNLLTIELAEII